MINIKKIKKNKSIQELLEFGIINIDKPSGPTSFNVSDFVRKNLKLRKTSHFGTLDPKVTGVLPIALNRACKLTGYFLGEDKEYVGVMRIHEDVSLEKIQGIINKKFLGKIKQTPPVKSRVKRQEREREVKTFELIEQEGKDILFRVECQGGTYIRKLIDDLGINLGIGAHMLELRRVRAGIFKENDADYPSVNLYDFEKAVEEYKKGDERLLRKIIIPAEIVSEVYPAVGIKKYDLQKIFTGKPIYREDLVREKKIDKDSVVSVFCEERFVGMYKIINGKEIFAKSEFVMQPIRN
ncbi:MAG: RNA-guided pseudouridylation complex pseudouridine synthase subunit Cbf5 [archaeon]